MDGHYIEVRLGAGAVQSLEVVVVVLRQPAEHDGRRWVGLFDDRVGGGEQRGVFGGAWSGWPEASEVRLVPEFVAVHAETRVPRNDEPDEVRVVGEVGRPPHAVPVVP